MRIISTTLALLLAALAASGCESAPVRYAKARGLDLLDVVPVSVSAGYGAAGEIRFTPYLGLGAGWANQWRVGQDEQRFGPLWWEKQRGIPFIRYYRYQDYEQRTARWPGGDRYRWDEIHRKRATSLLILPGMVRDGELWFPMFPPYFIETPWEWPNWSGWDFLNLELGLFAGVAGARVALSPLQFLDFFAGIFTFDPAEDDPLLHAVRWPDAEAERSFPPLPHPVIEPPPVALPPPAPEPPPEPVQPEGAPDEPQDAPPDDSPAPIEPVGTDV